MKELTHIQFQQLITAHGFAVGYFLRPQPLEAAWRRLCRSSRPPHTGQLCMDPATQYPWASTIVLLVYAYTPFAANSMLPGYYIASNAGYHAANMLKEELTALGYRAQRIEVPLAALVMEQNAGRLLKNALLDINGFGTRTALFTLITDACSPLPISDPSPSSCGDCCACANACPANAIDAVKGLDATRCLRTYMEEVPIPDWVAQRLPGLLGCEICQSVCPRNVKLGTRAPTEHEQEAFDLERLASGNIAAARMLVGKNMCTRGRLQAQAEVLRARK